MKPGVVAGSVQAINRGETWLVPGFGSRIDLRPF